MVDGLEPVLNVTASVLAEVRRSTGLFRGFWKFIGQSVCTGLKGACVSRSVSSPGLSPEFAESMYDRAMSVVPFWSKSPRTGAGEPITKPMPLLPGISHDFAIVPSLRMANTLAPSGELKSFRVVMISGKPSPSMSPTTAGPYPGKCGGRGQAVENKVPSLLKR